MSWLAHNLANIVAEYRAEPTVGGLAYPGSRFLVSGEPESLKSWLAAVLAVDRVQANENVVWIDFEQGPAMTRERLVALGLTADDLARVYYIEPREPLSDDGRAQLVENVSFVRPSLTVVDAYAGLLGVHDHDPNSERDIERVNRRVVDVFRDAGSTVLILDHVVKARDNRSRYSSGNGRKLAEVEAHIGMERAKHFGRGQTGIARLRNHKDRLGGLPHPLVGELHLKSDPNTNEVSWEIRPPTSATPASEPASFRPTGLMERVSFYLELQPEPVSKRTIEEHVKGKGEYVRLAADCLVAEGFATASPGPRNSQLVKSARPYREADDRSRDAVGTHSEALEPKMSLDRVPEKPHEQAVNDRVPARPDRVPTASPDAPNDRVPSPLPLGRDEDAVMGEDELERLYAIGDEMGLT